MIGKQYRQILETPIPEPGKPYEAIEKRRLSSYWSNHSLKSWAFEKTQFSPYFFVKKVMGFL